MKIFFIALVASIGIFGKTNTTRLPFSDSYNFTSTQMNFELSIPPELKSKLLIDETESAVVFRYENPGTDHAVFLFSITRVSESAFMQVKDNLTSANVLSNKNGLITYSETTDEKSLPEKNKTEFKQILSRINEVLKTFKEI